MVSLNERQALAEFAEADPELKTFQRLIEGDLSTVVSPVAGGLHGELLGAIATSDAARFLEIVTQLGERKIKPESDWCHDDYLIFLLLLGKEKFGCPLPFLGQVFDARRKNSNPVPQKINEVFSALDRGEFGIDGEFGFLKIPFLHLIGKLRLGADEAGKALGSLSAPGLLSSFSPFLQLLTTKAYDLVLLERQPVPTETVSQLIQGFETHAKDLSLRNIWRILTVLPGRFIWGGVILAVAVFPVLFGIGKGLVDQHPTAEERKRPAVVSVAQVRTPNDEWPAEALAIARAWSQPVGAGKRSLVFSLQTTPFEVATPSFVIEAAHPQAAFRNAFAFVRGQADEPGVFTVVPVQRDGGRFRALIPPQPVGRAVYFVLEMEAELTESADVVGRRVILRPMN